MRDPENWFYALQESGDEQAIADYNKVMDEKRARDAERTRFFNLTTKQYYQRKKEGREEWNEEERKTWDDYMAALDRDILDGFWGKPSILEGLMDRMNLNETERQEILEKRWKRFPWRKYEWENYKAGGWG
jgi:hypothetical protein